MHSFSCENNEIRHLLGKLYGAVSSQGGWLNPALVIHESNGELNVSSTLDASSREPLIRIPESCLPGINDFEFYSEDDSLHFRSIGFGKNELHDSLLNLMTDIYNHTRKLRTHRHSCPWLVFSGALKVIDKFYEGRAQVPKVKKCRDQIQSGSFERLLIDSYLGARTIKYKLSDDETAVPRLMPFIGFMNHHRLAAGFQMKPDETQTGSELYAVNSKPVTDSAECYVCYSKANDAFDTYLIYGFSDKTVPFVRSVPVEIIFPNGEMMIVNSEIVTGYKGNIPAALENLRPFIPRPVVTGAKVELSSLIIPGEKTPLALRRILKFFIQSILENSNRTMLDDYVLYAEAIILDTNIEYYSELKELISTIDKPGPDQKNIETANMLVNEQLTKLHSYKQRLSLAF